MYPATSDKENVSFHLLNGATGHRLKQQYVDNETGTVVDRDNRVKGYEVAKGDYVIVSDEELAAIEVESTHTIEAKPHAAPVRVRPLRKGTSSCPLRWAHDASTALGEPNDGQIDERSVSAHAQGYLLRRKANL